MSLATGEASALVQMDASAWPAWSPDGTRIAFMGVDDGPFDLYVANVDGDGATVVTDTRAEEHQPDW